MSLSTYRVLVVDDHPILRAGIHRLLNQSQGITVVGDAGNGQEALTLVEDLSPDVILLDLRMPVMDGLEVVHALRERRSPVKVLVFSAHSNELQIQSLFSLGITGYMLKEETPATIVRAVLGVAQGEKGWVSRRVASTLSANLRSDLVHYPILTNRQKQVLSEVSEGKTNQEIGFMLGVSEKTVEKHLIAIFNKLEVDTRVEAAVMAVRQGWV